MSDTPRTDALACSEGTVDADHARELERELAEYHAANIEQARLLGLGEEREAALMVELASIKRELVEKNETANTFMGQIRRLQAELAEAREALRSADQHNHEISVKLEMIRQQRDTLAEALRSIQRHGPIMGSAGDYRQGQLDVLESVARISNKALAAVKGVEP